MGEQLITGTHHVNIKASNQEMFEKAIGFYQNVLGLKLVRRWGEGEKSAAMLSTGNSIIELNASGNEKSKGTINHFALSTNDVDKVVDTVRAAGYEITVEPKDVNLPTEPVYAIRIAFCNGPCGESIEFFHEK